jgi:Uma2 family endonuclease
MVLSQTLKRYTPEEYYVLERAAEYKSEYFSGEIFAMAGTTTRHARVNTNLLGELYQRLKGKRCTPLTSDQRIKVKATGLRTYPDMSVFCGRMEYDAEDAQRETAVNPTMLFEVLSESTEGYDRGTKAEHYRRIESLQAYALISQHAPHVELFERQKDGTWRLTEATGLSATLPMPAIEIELLLGELYAGVEFDEPPHLKIVRPG